MAADSGHAADDFMSRHDRKKGVFPLVAGLMQVRVTNATEQHFNLYIMRAQLARFVIERRQRGFRVLSSVGVRNIHGVSRFVVS